MINSPEINELAAALSKAQKMTKPAQMNAINPFFKSKYADLGAVIESCRDALAENGLSIMQLPYSREGRIGVESVLLHSSGQYISTVMDIPTAEGGRSDAQAAGSIISYLRRYMLAAMVGLYADEDTDGNTKKAESAKPAIKPADNGKSHNDLRPAEEPKPELVGSGEARSEQVSANPVQALVEAGLSDTSIAASGLLNKHYMPAHPGPVDIAKLLPWARLYRGWKDADPKLSSSDAAERANAGLAPQG